MNARITESNNLPGSFFVQLRDDSEIELLQTNDLINLIWDIKNALVKSGRSESWVHALTVKSPFVPEPKE